MNSTVEAVSDVLAPPAVQFPAGRGATCAAEGQFCADGAFSLLEDFIFSFKIENSFRLLDSEFVSCNNNFAADLSSCLYVPPEPCAAAVGRAVQSSAGDLLEVVSSEPSVLIWHFFVPGRFRVASDNKVIDLKGSQSVTASLNLLITLQKRGRWSFQQSSCIVE